MVNLNEILSKDFVNALEKAQEGIGRREFEEIIIVHHNDADGITSGSILNLMFSALGMETKMYCIEKTHPAISEKIHNTEGNLIIYVDLGGLAGEAIRRVDNNRNLVLILDHHPAVRVEDTNTLIIDSELFDVSGDLFISASTLAYLFCHYIIDNSKYIIFDSVIRKTLRKCVSLAVIGAVGDYHDRSGGVLGYDRFALNQALEQGDAKIEVKGAKERYYITSFGEYADTIADYLTTLGSVGYYKGYYKLGVDACLNGFKESTIEKANELKKIKEEKFDEKIEEIKKEGMKKSKHMQWINVENDFYPMGVKVIGLFCHLIKDMSFVDDSKFVAGFQDFIPELPEIGKISWHGVKASFRAPASMERKVFSGEIIGFDVTVPEATARVNGFADATHKVAAACLIDKGKEKEFIKEWEKVFEEEQGKKKK